MRLVIGCPVAERGWILPHWFDAIYAQDIDVEIICVFSPSVDNTEAILKEENVTIIYDERPPRPINEIDHHGWGGPDKYEYMASMRNALIDAALDREVDYFFSLDSDILLNMPGTLKTLLDFAATHSGVVAPAVNMGMHDTAWNTMNWIDPYHPNTAIRSVKHNPKGGQVDVVMAAMLLDKKGLEARWCSHYQGEDIGFSLDAYQKQIPLWWLPNVLCQHVMQRY
jgi:hypothetical protein